MLQSLLLYTDLPHAHRKCNVTCDLYRWAPRCRKIIHSEFINERWEIFSICKATRLSSLLAMTSDSALKQPLEQISHFLPALLFFYYMKNNIHRRVMLLYTRGVIFLFWRVTLMFSICTVKGQNRKAFLYKKDPLSIRVPRLTGCGLTVFSSQFTKKKRKKNRNPLSETIFSFLAMLFRWWILILFPKFLIGAIKEMPSERNHSGLKTSAIVY